MKTRRRCRADAPSRHENRSGPLRPNPASIIDVQRNATPFALPATLELDDPVGRLDTPRARDSRPCLFVNFGEYVGGDFYVVLWEEALRELAARKWTVDRLREALCGERVAVTGVLATYRAGARVNPQIEYQEPGRLVVFRPPQRGGNIVI